MKVASPERYVRKLRRGIADEVDYDGIAVRVAGDLLAAGSWGKSGAGRWRGAIGRPSWPWRKWARAAGCQLAGVVWFVNWPGQSPSGMCGVPGRP